MSSTDWQQINTDTYNSQAKQFQIYFDSMSSHIVEIELGLELANAANKAHVIEIGCGTGTQATEIVRRVSSYTGFDPSTKLLDLAKARVPTGSFVQALAQTFDYSDHVDVVYAFASLLHINGQEMPRVIQKAKDSLRIGGTFVMTLKEHSAYKEEIKVDRFGQRMFYYYNTELIKKCAGSDFEIVHESHQSIDRTNWLTLILKKSTTPMQSIGV